MYIDTEFIDVDDGLLWVTSLDSEHPLPIQGDYVTIHNMPEPVWRVHRRIFVYDDVTGSMPRIELYVQKETQ